jgi:hypothetical protein
MHVLGLSSNYHLRVLNGFIHLAFIYFAIQDYRLKFPESVENYVSGVSVGMYTSVIGVALFTLFMCIFLSLDVNQAFFSHLKSGSPMPRYFTPFTASLFIFVEGIVVSLIGSYLVTRIIDARMVKKERKA